MGCEWVKGGGGVWRVLRRWVMSRARSWGGGLVMGRKEGEEETVKGEEETVRGEWERAYPVEIIKKTVVLVVIVGVFGKVG